MLNLVTEIDHQMKAMESRLINQITDRDAIFDRIENQINKITQNKPIRSLNNG